jgi:hypothetical protein
MIEMNREDWHRSLLKIKYKSLRNEKLNENEKLINEID